VCDGIPAGESVTPTGSSRLRDGLICVLGEPGWGARGGGEEGQTLVNPGDRTELRSCFFITITGKDIFLQGHWEAWAGRQIDRCDFII
jgi:hypothetical protein